MSTVNRGLIKTALIMTLTGVVAACNRGAPPAESGAAASSAATAATVPVVTPESAAAAPPAGAPIPSSAAADQPLYAKVLSVTPVRAVDAPKEVCRDEVVTQTAPPRDQHQIAGTAIGAVLGGVLGHQVGHGSGRTLATVAGAVGGGYAGKRIEENRQQPQVSQSVQRHCRQVQSAGDAIVAYDVRYEYKGVVRSVRMDHDPGDRVQVQEGVISVSDAK